MVDRQQGAGLETSFANAGQVSPGYSAPWAGPGIPVKAMKWFDDAAPAIRDLAARRRPARLVARADARQLHRAGLPHQQSAHGPPGRIQPRRPARAAGRNRDRVRPPRAGHAAAVPHPDAARPHRRRHRRCWTSSACPTRCSTRPAASPPSRRSRACRTSSWAACACPATRPGTRTSSPSASPPSPPNAA